MPIPQMPIPSEGYREDPYDKFLRQQGAMRQPPPQQMGAPQLDMGGQPPVSEEQRQMAIYKLTEITFNELQKYRASRRPSPIPGLQKMEEIEHLKSLGLEGVEKYYDLANEIPIQQPGPEELAMQKKAEATLLWGRAQVMERNWSQEDYKKLEQKVQARMNAFKANTPFRKPPSVADMFQQQTIPVENEDGSRGFRFRKANGDWAFEREMDAPKDPVGEKDVWEAEQAREKAWADSDRMRETAIFNAATARHQAAVERWKTFQNAKLEAWKAGDQSGPPPDPEGEPPFFDDYEAAVRAQFAESPYMSYEQYQQQGQMPPQQGQMPQPQGVPNASAQPGPNTPQPTPSARAMVAKAQQAVAQKTVDSVISEYAGKVGIPDFDIRRINPNNPEDVEKMGKIIDKMVEDDFDKLPAVMQALEAAWR